MALGTDHYSGADVAVFTPEVWGMKVNDFFRESLECATFFTDRSDEVAMGGDVLYTPGTTAFTTNAKAAQTEVTLQSPTETAKTLTINQHKEASFLLEDIQRAQLKKSYNLRERRAKDLAYAVAEDLEVAITSLFSGFSNTVGSTGVALTEAVCREAISDLGDNIKGAFREEDVRFILARKTVWQDAMTSDRFVSFDFGQEGTGRGGQRTPYIYGIEVIVTSNVQTINSDADYAGALAHADAIHFATAALPGASTGVDGTPGVRLQASYIQEYLGELVTADILYGVVENRDEAAIQIISAV